MARKTKTPRATKTVTAPLATQPAASDALPAAPVMTQPATTDAAPPVGYEQVARRAYELFLARGGAHGHHLEDWIQAERELAGRAAN